MHTLPASMKKLTRTSLVFVLSVFFAAAAAAQAPSLTLGSVQACAAQEVLVPVTGANLQDVGALTLYITFDSARIDYLSLENIDEQLTGINYSLNPEPFQLAIVWSKINPAQFLQKKLFDIRFAFHGESSPVTFKANCEISNSQLTVLPVNYISGSVASAVPSITLQPRDTAVRVWASAAFRTQATNTQEYLWQQSKDNGQAWTDLSDDPVYQGTRTGQLTLNYVYPAFDNYRYRCILTSQGCTTNTSQATLTVDSVSSVQETADSKDFLLQNKPNPVSGFTQIEYTLPENGEVSVQILDLCGHVIAGPVGEKQATGRHSIRFDASALQPGIYFYCLKFRNDHRGYTASRKMIKTD
jgi:hypothetical protein